MEAFRDAFPALKGVARVRRVVRDAALSAGARFANPARSLPAVRALYCHYVFDDQVPQFDAMLRGLLEIGRFIGTDELLTVVAGQQPAPAAQTLFHLSFDDGFRNVVKNALPVLRAHGVPATFFVPTSYIRADGGAGPAGDTVRKGVEMASWRDLEAAVAAGLEVGSHTRTHARFTDISGSPREMEDEIARSKEDIEARLGACRCISWPYGRVGDADERSISAVRAAGYEACFGAFRGRVTPGATDRFRIPRHHIEVDWPRDHVRFFASGAMESAAA